MKIEIEIPDYDGNALDVIWDHGGKYTIVNLGNDVIIKANEKGLISLAKQMLYIALNDLPEGSHVHYNSFFTCITDSLHELIIEKIE